MPIQIKLKNLLIFPLLTMSIQPVFAQNSGYIAPNSGYISSSNGMNNSGYVSQNYNYNNQSNNNKMQDVKTNPNKKDKFKNNMDLSKLTPDELQAMMMAGGKNIDKETIKNQAQQMKAMGGKLTRPPSVGPNGEYIAGVIKNKNGSQTLILPPSQPTNPAKYGAFVPPPPRAPGDGSPTGNKSNLQNTFVGRKSITAIGQIPQNNQNNNSDSETDN